MVHVIFQVSLLFLVIALAYLWHVNRSFLGSPDEAAQLAQRRWTDNEIREAYKRIQNKPPDVSPSLTAKKGRRYIVVGGSGKLTYHHNVHMLT